MKALLRFTLARILPVAVLVVLLVVMTHVYNLWTGLGYHYPVRRTIATIGLGVLLFGPAIVMRRRVAQFIYLGIMSTLVAALLIAHFIYNSYAGGFLSVSTVKYLWQLQSLGGSVAALLSPRLLFFLLLPLAVLVLFFFRPRSVLPPVRRRITALLAGMVLLVPALSFGYIIGNEIRVAGNAKMILDNPFNSDELVKKVGILNYSVYDGLKYAFRKKELTEAERQTVLSLKDRYRFKPEGQAYHGIAKGKNLIFVQLESIQQFLVGLNVGGKAVTPNLNQLAKDSRAYTNFHYMVGPGTSSDSEFTALNSLMYLGDAAAYFEYPDNNYVALPGVLRAAGYSATAYHGDTANYWNRSSIYPHMGYEDYVDIKRYTSKEQGISWGTSDRDFYEQTVPMLEKLPQPFYAHVITLSSHTPFKLPAEYQKLNVGGLAISQLQKDYLQAAHYADAALGEFIADLKARGLWDNTVFVVTGDHEGFMAAREDVAFAQFLGNAGGHTDLSDLRARRVPFMIHATGLPAGPDTTPGSHLDVYPTLMNLLGLETPPAVLGRDLLNTKDPLVARRRRSTGINLEMVVSQAFTYVGAPHSSSFADGRCYRDGQPVDLTLCQPDYDRAMERIKLSDLLVRGNALDLMK